MQSSLTDMTENPKISCLFLTYNRSDLLSISVRALRQACRKADVQAEFVISDDSSEPAQLAEIQRLGADCLVCSEKNKGLGHNSNEGLAACRGEYVLQVQDDWEFVGRPTELRNAIEILDRDKDVGVVNFLPPSQPLSRDRRQLQSGQIYDVFVNDNIDKLRPSGSRPYSDRPHLKRVRFVRDLGPYLEGVDMSETELDFELRVACQQRWRIAYIHNNGVFRHLGDDRTFNPIRIRQKRLEQIYQFPILGPAYRAIRWKIRNWFKSGKETTIR